MPVCEAKSCGVPAMAIDYSAMSEHCECIGTWKLKTGSYYYETVGETEQRRSLPDNNDTARKLYMFFNNHSAEERQKWSGVLRQDAINHFSFDRGAKIIENAIDSLEILDRSQTWDLQEKNLLKINFKIPEYLSNGEFIDYLFTECLKQPEKISTEWRNELVKGLNIGYIDFKGQRKIFDRNVAIEMIKELIAINNFWETQRVAKLDKKEEAIEWSMV